MSSLKALIKRWPLLSYFLLTFAISGGAVLWVIGGPDGIPGSPEVTAKLLPFGVLALVAGPSVAGILMTLIVHGGSGLRGQLIRSLKGRVGFRWYAFALLITPLVTLAVLLPLSRIDPMFTPGLLASHDKASLLLSALLAGVFAGLFEEIGWTGFAVPVLLRRHGVLATGLIVGFLWGAWHYIAALWGSGDADGAFSAHRFLPPFLFYVVVLPVFRVLMVWVYDRTRNLIVVMLMHASLTANTIFLCMPAAQGEELSIYYLVLGLALWIMVAATMAGDGRAIDPARA